MCHAREKKNSEFLTETKTNCVQMRKVHKRVVAGKSREEQKTIQHWRVMIREGKTERISGIA